MTQCHIPDHIPVLLKEVIHSIAPQAHDIIVDATFGAGGYSRAILEKNPKHLLSFDRDPNVTPFVEKLAQDYPNTFTFIPHAFSTMQQELAHRNISQVQAIVADLGVSSMQLDHAERGFSFQQEGPLDMRMSQKGQSAADVVNTASIEDLTTIIKEFGEEKHAKFIAQKIAQHRTTQLFENTLQLANLIKSTYPGNRHGKTHPATKTFQALRIYVNQELEELQNLLDQARALLSPGGRLVIVTFHSLEDRIVKNFFKTYGNIPPTHGNRHLPLAHLEQELPSTFGYFKADHKKSIAPAEEELKQNRRARSAKLRCYIKLEKI